MGERWKKIHSTTVSIQDAETAQWCHNQHQLHTCKNTITINTSLQFLCSFNGIQMWYHVKWNFFTIHVMYHTEFLIIMKPEWYFISAIEFQFTNNVHLQLHFWTTAHNSLTESCTLTSNKELSESNDSNFLSPYILLFIGLWHSESLGYSRSYSSSHKCFAWQTAASQLLLKRQRFTIIQNNKQW
jgi:hypothetical protein